MSNHEEYCDCGEAITVYDNGDGITRHSGCGKPHYASVMAEKITHLEKELKEAKSELFKKRTGLKGYKDCAHGVSCDICMASLEKELAEAREALKLIADGGLFNPAKYESIARNALARLDEGEGK